MTDDFLRQVQRAFPGAVVTRFYQTLRSDRDRARATLAVAKAPEGYAVEIREPKRTDDQNAALWSLLGQIAKQRPQHNGVEMSPELWKCVFLDALGAEMTMLPKLDGRGYFPLGHRSSHLGKSEFSALLELMLAWCAEQNLTIKHFDGAEGGGAGSDAGPRRERAA